MAVATTLFEGPDLYFAELWCPPEDPDWGEHNVTTHPILALPCAPVWQAHDGDERRLLNQNDVVLHSTGGEYRRERFDDAGYRCLFLFPCPSLAREVLVEWDPSAADREDVRFEISSGPLDARTFLLSRTVARHLRSVRGSGAGAREALYEVVRGAILASARQPSPRRPTSPATGRARREIVEHARAMLTRRVGESVSLDTLARSVFTSPYHLARVFRATTGFSIHGYATNLRLRMALDELGQRASVGGIGDAAIEFGYASHSHFTASFRRTFGLTPSTALGLALTSSPDRARSR
jgi:AraC family transcriptional regulator